MYFFSVLFKVSFCCFLLINLNDAGFFDKKKKTVKEETPVIEDELEYEEPVIELIKSDCNCRLGSVNKIIGGQKAEKNEIPWQVSLQKSEIGHFCGATIINPYHVLTSASCVYEEFIQEKMDNITVHVGLHNLVDKKFDRTHYVFKVHLNNFNLENKTNDIAILELKEPIRFKKGEVEPACFNFDKRTYKEQVMISGWGKTTQPRKNMVTREENIGEVSQVLKKAYVDATEEDCSDYHICITSKDGISPCHGDGGGPLHYTENGVTFVEGIDSFGDSRVRMTEVTKKIVEKISCLGQTRYTRLSKYKKYVEEVVGTSFCPLLE